MHQVLRVLPLGASTMFSLVASTMFSLVATCLRYSAQCLSALQLTITLQIVFAKLPELWAGLSRDVESKCTARHQPTVHSRLLGSELGLFQDCFIIARSRTNTYKGVLQSFPSFELGLLQIASSESACLSSPKNSSTHPEPSAWSVAARPPQTLQPCRHLGARSSVLPGL